MSKFGQILDLRKRISSIRAYGSALIHDVKRAIQWIYHDGIGIASVYVKRLLDEFSWAPVLVMLIAIGSIACT